MIDRTLDVYGQLDVLVNNAGVSITVTTGETDLEGWRWVHAVNLDGMFLGTKLAAVPMKERGGGSVVNISSMWASVGVPGYAAYCASKGGATNFTKAAAPGLCAIQHPGERDSPRVHRDTDDVG